MSSIRAHPFPASCTCKPLHRSYIIFLKSLTFPLYLNKARYLLPSTLRPRDCPLPSISAQQKIIFPPCQTSMTRTNNLFLCIGIVFTLSYSVLLVKDGNRHQIIEINYPALLSEVLGTQPCLLIRLELALKQNLVVIHLSRIFVNIYCRGSTYHQKKLIKGVQDAYILTNMASSTARKCKYLAHCHPHSY